MQTLQPVLLYGHYEWQRDLQPVAEFESRLAAVTYTMQRQDWDALVVHGNSRDNAALCHLTNVVPNQRWGLALIAPDRRPQIVASVGARDIPAIQRLTWVDDVRASGEVRTPLTQWLTAIAANDNAAGRPLKIAVADLAQMRANVGRDVAEVCGRFGETIDATPALASLRQPKSRNELALLRACHGLLRNAFAEIEQRRQAGSAIAPALIAAERSARLAGAQDVRMLCNAGAQGVLRPVSVTAQAQQAREPWCIYLAVRFCGYWTEGVTTLADQTTPTLQAARAALTAAAGAARAGTTGRQLWDAMAPHLEGFGRSSMLGSKIARAHSLALDTEPWITADSSEPLHPDNAYVITATAVDADGQHALESTTIVLDQPRPDVLPSAPSRPKRSSP